MDRVSRMVQRAQRLRLDILDAAVPEIARVGCRRLPVQPVGGPRTVTLHDLFGSREAMVSGLVTHVLAGVWDVFDPQLSAAEDDLSACLHYARHLVLVRGSTDPALRSMLEPAADDDVVRLFTVDDGPELADARVRLIASLMRVLPDADPSAVHEAADVLARLVVSHVVHRLDSLDEASHAIGAMIAAVVHGGRMPEPVSDA